MAELKTKLNKASPVKFLKRLILAIVSLVLSMTAFLFVNDPEGPNLLIVVVLAAIIYGVLWTVYFLFSKRNK